MRSLNRDEALRAFDQLFADARHTMFKAEVLQDYTAIDDSPSLRAWLAGDKQQAIELGHHDVSLAQWRDQCLASPATITRVHIVDEPLTPYLGWEITVVYQNTLLASGAESVSLALREQLTNITLPDSDFWLFDETRVLQWQYSVGTGQLAGGLLADSGDDLAHFLSLRNALLAAARPIKR